MQNAAKRLMIVFVFTMAAIFGVGTLFGQGYAPAASAGPLLPDGGLPSQGANGNQDKDKTAGGNNSSSVPTVDLKKCATEVHYYTLDEPGNDYGPPLKGNTAREKLDDLQGRYTHDPALFVADVWHAAKHFTPAMAKANPVLAKYATLDTEQKRQDKTKALVANCNGWNGDLQQFIKLQNASNPTLVTLSGSYKTAMMVPQGSNPPLIHELNLNATHESIQFTMDGKKVNYQTSCGGQGRDQISTPVKMVGPTVTVKQVVTIHKVVKIVPPPPVKTCEQTNTCPKHDCTNGSTGPWPSCPLPCPTGTTGAQPNCQPPTCPEGTSGTYPNCHPPACPNGQVGTPPNCHVPSCPEGQVGNYPNCHVPTCQETHTCTCPQGQTGTYPDCHPPQCPTGQTGTYPNCHPPACPNGQVGTPPNCHVPSCPEGTTGHYPHCKPVHNCGCTDPGEVQQQPIDGNSSTTPGTNPTPPSSSTPAPADNRDHGSGASQAPSPTHGGSDSGSGDGSGTPSGTHTGSGTTTNSGSGDGDGHVSDANGGNNGTDGGNTSTGDGQISNPFGNG